MRPRWRWQRISALSWSPTLSKRDRSDLNGFGYGRADTQRLALMSMLLAVVVGTGFGVFLLMSRENHLNLADLR